MINVTILYGGILTVLGLYAYFGVSSESITALIPTFFGIPAMILGFVAINDKFTKHTMHIAAALALLAFLGTVMGLLKLPSLISGAEIERPTAVMIQSTMSILSLVYVILSVGYFIKRRRE